MQVGDCKGYDVWYNMMYDGDVVSYKSLRKESKVVQTKKQS